MDKAPLYFTSARKIKTPAIILNRVFFCQLLKWIHRSIVVAIIGEIIVLVFVFIDVGAVDGYLIRVFVAQSAEFQH